MFRQIFFKLVLKCAESLSLKCAESFPRVCKPRTDFLDKLLWRGCVQERGEEMSY